MKIRKIDNDYFLRIDKGEEFVSKLIDFVKSENIQAGVISGIGALTDVTLGYFNRKDKKYTKQTFTDIYELLSLNGNVSYFEDEPVVHVHCTLGKADYQVIGGHLFSGIVAVTGEIYIHTFPEKFSRRKNDEFNLNLLSF